METKHNIGRRQKIRTVVAVINLMLFPASFYWFSPYVSAMGAVGGIISGSILLFALLFASALFVGRLFCSWVCPAGALMDLAAKGRTRPAKRPFLAFIKYLIWAPWVVCLAVLFVQAPGGLRVDPLYATEYGFSATSLPGLIMYLMVAGLFLILALVLGRRGPCHTICWMAPFMVLGRGLSRLLGLPGLRLSGDAKNCIACGKCTSACPMSLPVQEMLAARRIDHHDCILCANCVDTCPKACLRLAWRAPRLTNQEGLD